MMQGMQYNETISHLQLQLFDCNVYKRGGGKQTASTFLPPSPTCPGKLQQEENKGSKAFPFVRVRVCRIKAAYVRHKGLSELV